MGLSDKDLFAGENTMAERKNLKPAYEADPDEEDTDEAQGRYRPSFKAADYPRRDLTNPSQFRMSVQHVANMHSIATPAEVQTGREWYPKVHEAVAKGVRGTSMDHRQGSALVAALSPNMDWDKVNIPAFHELGSLKESDWDTIHASHEQPRVRSRGGASKAALRSSEASRVLQGMSLSQVPDSNLVKAHRLLQGQSLEDVLPRRTAPKTNSFAEDIHDPSSRHVTIDGRAHDIAQNQMWPWTYSGRGISSAALPSATKLKKNGEPGANFGKKTRYEHFEEAYRTAAEGVGEEPTAMQAITWGTGKRLEKSFPTKSGAPRVKGVARVKQPYPGI